MPSSPRGSPTRPALTGEERSATFYVSLLRSMGCTSNAHETAALFGGEDPAVHGASSSCSPAPTAATGREGAARHVATVCARVSRAQRDPQWFATEGQDRRARRARLGLRGLDVAGPPARAVGGSCRQSLDQVYERWDGDTASALSAGTDLHLPARISHVVDIVEIAWRAGGVGRRARDRRAALGLTLRSCSSP